MGARGDLDAMRGGIEPVAIRQHDMAALIEREGVAVQTGQAPAARRTRPIFATRDVATRQTIDEDLLDPTTAQAFGGARGRRTRAVSGAGTVAVAVSEARHL